MLIFSMIVFAAVLFYVTWRLYKTNLPSEVVLKAERPLGPLALLHFAIDNDIPIK